MAVGNYVPRLKTMDSVQNKEMFIVKQEFPHKPKIEAHATAHSSFAISCVHTSSLALLARVKNVDRKHKMLANITSSI
jgi:hypothetical protein